MTTPSGEPYQYGDDTVAARLEVDIPADAINNLTDLNRLTADIRANMEATAKYNQDYVGYLRELPNAIGQVSAAQGELSTSQSAIFGGGNGEPIPRDPFAGRNYGDGTSPMAGSGAGRPMRGVDQDTLIGLARDNPRQVANMAADRGLDDYFDGDGGQVLPRPAPQPGAGREMRGERTGGGAGSGPGGAQRSPAGTGPGNGADNSAGTGTGRQVTPEGTESAAERAATRLLAELDGRSDDRDIGQRARGVGDSVQNNSLLNFLNREGGTRGSSDAIGFAGGLGRMAQSSAEGLQGRLDATETQRQALLAQAAEVESSNPALAAQLAGRAGALAGSATGSSGMLARAAPLLKGIGIAGAGAAAAAGVNSAVQNTGETLLDLQGEGVQMGGGIKEGIGFEASIRTMAMNPFISTEQSRKIMQSALQTGYTGKEMDTMTEFMAENLKNMNIEVAESTKLLQQNVLKGGQSTESVQAQLSQNVAMAGSTNMSADQLNQAYGRISGSLIDQGAAGAPAGALAQSFSTMFEGSDVLKDSGGDLMNRLLTTDTVTQSHFARRAGMGPEVPLSSAGAWATDELSTVDASQMTIEAIGDRIRTYIDMYARGNKYQARKQVAQELKINENEAQELLEQYVDGSILTRAAENEAEWEENGGGKINTSMNKQGGKARSFFSMDQIKGDLNQASVWWNQLTGDEEGEEKARTAQHNADSRSRMSDELTGASGAAAFTPEVLEQLALAEHGGSLKDITIVEGDKERKITDKDLGDKKLMERLRGGDIQVKTESGGIQTLREWGNTANTSEQGSGGMSHVVELSEETRRFFKLNSPNIEQQKADQGRGSRNSTDAGLERGGYN